MPNGLLFLAAVLEKAGHEVQIYDNAVDQRKVPDFLAFNPSLIGFSVYTTPDILLAIVQSQRFRTILPTAKIVWGGVHPSLMPRQTIMEDYIDYVVVGAGEKPIVALASCLEKGSPELKDIPGLVYKEGDNILTNEQSYELKNLDVLPDPAWHLIDINKYYEVTLDTSRGCPFSCTFCYNSVFHSGQRGDFSAERIISQVELLQAKYGVDYICFFEDNFTYNKKRLRTFCQSIIDKKIQLKWECESRASLSEADIALMAKAGCVWVALGVETGSPQLLKFLKKGVNLDEMKATFWNLIKYRIMPAVYIMDAIPTETMEDFKLTQRLLHELDDTPFEYARFIPYPETPLYNYCVENHLVPPPKNLTEWAFFSDYHSARANLSQVPDKIIDDAFADWENTYTTRYERFSARHSMQNCQH
jgi:radical SAM superfamily enzyme YgiQ (UPF0313 family)